MTLLIESFWLSRQREGRKWRHILTMAITSSIILAKFEKFLLHSITVPSFKTAGSQMPKLDWGGGCFSPPSPI